MRRVAPALAVMLAASAAAAAEVAIGGPYGNEAGCALLANAAEIPPGVGLVVFPTHLATEQTLCIYQEVTAEAAGWRIVARCTQDRVIRYRSEFALIEEPDRSAVSIAAIDSPAPTGRYRACQTVTPAGRPAARDL